MLGKCKKKYDFVFSLSEACSSTQALRDANLQNRSYPFDWLYGSDFKGRINILLSEFNRFIDIDDLVDENINNGDLNNLCHIYSNKYNGIVFNHDFPENESLNTSYNKVLEKFQRRINRLFNNINCSKKILFVYIETPNIKIKTSNEDILESMKKIKNKYPDKEIDLLIFSNDKLIKKNKYILEKLSENITKVRANYKRHEHDKIPYRVKHKFLVKLLKNLCFEKISMKEKILNLFNFKKSNVKKYDHIISLGYNCEVSYQFFKYYHFVESSLFAWCNTINIDNLIFAINNLDKLITGKLENVKPMWKCFNTNIRFHGKAPMKIWTSNEPVNIEIINEDRNELISRISYLKEKFIKTSNDNKKNLYIFKYLVTTEKIEDIEKNINDLYLSLNKIAKNEFDLLIIIEKQKIPTNFQEKFADKNIFIRTVDFFAPEDDVTGKNFDKIGWKKIFDEFKPNFKLKKTKKFKFEEV